MKKLINNAIKVFNTTLKGGLIVIGNTCTIVGKNKDNVRQFLKPNGNYTSNWRECGSNAFLELPKGSKIKYAVLEWHSTVSNSTSNGIIQESYFPITFKTPTKTFNVSIDDKVFSEAQYEDENNLIHSVKWTDVTKFLVESENGLYTVEGIPAATPFINANIFEDHDQRLGWSLSIVYENNKMPKRYIEINMGLKKQDYRLSSEQNSMILSGFNLLGGTKKCYLDVVAMNGNSNFQNGLNIYINDNTSFKYKLGNTISSKLENPNNKPIVPYDNVFSGIIMNTNTESAGYGLLETRSTNGTKNNDPYSIDDNLSFIGNRGKLDILSFDISDKLKECQDNLVLECDILDKDERNSFEIIEYAIQMDVDEELAYDLQAQSGVTLNLSVIKTNLRNTVSLNEPVEYKTEITNTSQFNLSNVCLLDYLPVNASFIKDSLSVNGTITNDNSIFDFKGLHLGDMNIGATITVKYKIEFYELPIITPVKLLPKLTYDYLLDTNIIKETTWGISTSLNIIKDPIGKIDLFINKSLVAFGEKVLYSLILRNNGTITATNVNLKDILPQGLTFVENSLILNGTPLEGNIVNGLILPDIFVGKEYLITFEVLSN